MRIKIVAWTKEGYSKVIADADDQQVLMHDLRINPPVNMAGLIVDPKNFPEMSSFSLQITDNNGCRVV